MDGFTQQKIPEGSPCSNLKLLHLLSCSGSSGSSSVYAEREAAGKSSCSLLLTCARPPQLSTSSTGFSKLGDFIVQRVQAAQKKETPHWYELHALSSPQHKSLKKIATMRLGCPALSWRGSCSNPQRLGMRTHSSEVSAIYRILICKDNTGAKT